MVTGGGGGGWINPLQTLSQGLVLTLLSRLALSLTIYISWILVFCATSGLFNHGGLSHTCPFVHPLAAQLEWMGGLPM